MHVSTPSELGALIRDRRKSLGLDQGALAERVGVSRLWVNEIEQGKPRAAVGLVLRTLAALGVQLDLTAGGEQGPVPAGEIPSPDLNAILDRARRPSGD